MLRVSGCPEYSGERGGYGYGLKFSSLLESSLPGPGGPGGVTGPSWVVRGCGLYGASGRVLVGIRLYEGVGVVS